MYIYTIHTDPSWVMIDAEQRDVCPTRPALCSLICPIHNGEVHAHIWRMVKSCYGFGLLSFWTQCVSGDFLHSHSKGSDRRSIGSKGAHLDSEVYRASSFHWIPAPIVRSYTKPTPMFWPDVFVCSASSKFCHLVGTSHFGWHRWDGQTWIVKLPSACYGRLVVDTICYKAVPHSYLS